MKEYIICSAVHFNDGKVHQDAPDNMVTGFVVGGRRHHNCFGAVVALIGKAEMDKLPVIPGFLTNLNRFVDRREGMVIAQREGQLLMPSLHEGLSDRLLTSEDLYPYLDSE